MNTQNLSNSGHNTTAQQAKERVEESAEHIQQEANKAISDVKDTLGDVADDALDQASSKLNEAKSQMFDAAEEKKEHLTGRLSSVADVLRQTGQQFRTQEDPSFAHYSEMAADQVEHFAGYLDSRDMGELIHNVQDFARRQPEIFIGGALAAGFFLGRFLKSSQDNQQHRPNSPRNAAYSSGYTAGRPMDRQMDRQSAGQGRQRPSQPNSNPPFGGSTTPHGVDPYRGASGQPTANPAKNDSTASPEARTNWRAESRATGIGEDA